MGWHAGPRFVVSSGTRLFENLPGRAGKGDRETRRPMVAAAILLRHALVKTAGTRLANAACEVWILSTTRRP